MRTPLFIRRLAPSASEAWPAASVPPVRLQMLKLSDVPPPPLERDRYTRLVVGGILKLAAVLAALGVVFAAAVVALMARLILHPPRMNDGKALARYHRLSPGDLGLRFETTPFTVPDAARPGQPLHLAAWWIPAARSARTAVVLHGFADAKVGTLDHAALLHHLGWNVLAVDLRAHGDSAGPHTTAGFFEREDIDAVLNQLRVARPAETRQVILVGLSLGGVVAAAVAARRDDLHALILDSLYPDGGKTAAAHARRVGAPHGLLLRMALRLAGVISRADFAAVRPLDSLQQVRAPLLVLIGERDELLDEEDVNTLRRAVAARAAGGRIGELALAPGATHLAALSVDPAWYTAAVRRFLDAISVDARPDPV